MIFSNILNILSYSIKENIYFLILNQQSQQNKRSFSIISSPNFSPFLKPYTSLQQLLILQQCNLTSTCQMISNHPIQPPLYHSYINSQRGQPSYLGYLDEIDTNISSKMLMKANRDQPVIGTFRVSKTNFEKRDRLERGLSGNTYLMSIALDKNYVQMGLNQIRIEDYYLIRTSKSDSELYRTVIPKSNSKIFFNSKLMNQALKIPMIYIPPKLPQVMNRIGLNQAPIVHGPYDRLSFLGNNQNTKHILHSLQNLQGSSFNQFGRSNIVSQNGQIGINALTQGSMINEKEEIREDVMKMVAEQINVNEMFLRFVHQQLYQAYSKKENIYNKVQNFINNAFMKFQNHQQKRLLFAHELKLKSQTPTNEIIQICKKYGECLFIKRILDGYQRDIQIKLQKTKPNPEQLQYYMSVWRMVQQTYNLHIKQLYRYTHNQITQEGFKKLIITLEQKQTSILFQQQRHQSFNQPLPIHKDTTIQTLNTMLLYQNKIDQTSTNSHQYYSNPLQSQQFQNQIFLLNSLKYQLSQLYEQQKLQRQQHLYDMMNSNISDYRYDEYAIRHRNNKKRDEISITIYREPTSQRKQEKQERWKQNPQSGSKKSINAKSQLKLNSFLLESNASLNVQYFDVEYQVCVFWDVKGMEKVKYRNFYGAFKISQVGQEKLEEIITEVSKSFLESYIRHDAQFKFHQMVKTKHKRFHYSINCQILQEKVNIPPPYIYIVKYKSQIPSQCEVEKLQIKNSFGQVRWKNVNIESFDFQEQLFSIGDNSIECSIKCLNQPCEITFYNFPNYVLKLEENYYPTAIQFKMKQKIQKKLDNELTSINWKDRRYTVSSKSFYEQTEEQRKQLSKSKKQNKKNLLSKYQLTDFTIQPSEK